MAVDEALAVRTMKKLQEQGLIEREKSVENGRSYAIYLTEKGEEIIPRLRNALAGWWAQVLSILSEEEQQRMISGVEKWHSSLGKFCKMQKNGKQKIP